MLRLFLLSEFWQEDRVQVAYPPPLQFLKFPAQRTSCYAADIIMRQYNRVRAIKGKSFSYRDVQQTCLIIFMEQSSREFLSVPDQFLHHRNISYSSGVQLPETVDILILLFLYKNIESWQRITYHAMSGNINQSQSTVQGSIYTNL